MSDANERPQRRLPSALDRGEGGPVPSKREIAAVEAAVAPVGLIRDAKVSSPGSQTKSYTLRISIDNEERLKHYAYMERLTVGEAIGRLLDIAEGKR